MEGWTDVSIAPDWADLVNRGWYRFSWDAEAIILEENINTVIGTVSYSLTNKVKRLLDVVYDTASTKVPLLHSTEDFERNLRADWRYQTSAVPARYTFNQFDTISLVPPPSAVKVVGVRELAQGVAFSLGSDIPSVPDYYHEAIAIAAAIFQGKVYAQGEAAQRLGVYEAQYQAYVDDFKSAASLQAQGN